MTVAVVVHLRPAADAGSSLRGWVEDVASGARTPVNGDQDLLARLHELVAGGHGTVAPGG